ncbi:MAG: DMT family transporter [Xylanivirga thermophila]|uniref:DMT family transporter n=1 Tax=Xylanivirga thermophila TaxID=2496273 RepID=UPI0039F59F07
MEEFFTKKLNVFIISIICTLLWGSAFPVVKISYEKLQIAPEDIYSKIYFAGLRFFIASMLVFLVAKLILRMDIRIKKKDIKPIVTLGMLQTSLQYFFFYIGVANTSGIKSAILQGSGTFFTVLAAHFVYSDDRINMRKILSLVLGFGGILAINMGKGFDSSFTFMGEGFLLLSALVSTIATIYVKSISQDIDPVILTGSQMFAGSILLLIVGKVGMHGGGLNFNSTTIGLLVYAAFISSCAFLLWYTLLKYNKAGEISIYRLFIPVFGSMLSVAFIEGETFTIKLFIGLLMVVAGMTVLNAGNGHKNM